MRKIIMLMVLFGLMGSVSAEIISEWDGIFYYRNKTSDSESVGGEVWVYGSFNLYGDLADVDFYFYRISESTPGSWNITFRNYLSSANKYFVFWYNSTSQNNIQCSFQPDCVFLDENTTFCTTYGEQNISACPFPVKNDSLMYFTISEQTSYPYQASFHETRPERNLPYMGDNYPAYILGAVFEDGQPTITTTTTTSTTTSTSSTLTPPTLLDQYFNITSDSFTDYEPLEFGSFYGINQRSGKNTGLCSYLNINKLYLCENIVQGDNYKYYFYHPELSEERDFYLLALSDYSTEEGAFFKYFPTAISQSTYNIINLNITDYGDSIGSFTADIASGNIPGLCDNNGFNQLYYHYSVTTPFDHGLRTNNDLICIKLVYTFPRGGETVTQYQQKNAWNGTSDFMFSMGYFPENSSYNYCVKTVDSANNAEISGAYVVLKKNDAIVASGNSPLSFTRSTILSSLTSYTASKTGYQPIVFSGNIPLPLAPSCYAIRMDATGVNFTYYTVSGYVVDEDDNILRNVLLRWQTGESAYTDNTGYYEFSVLQGTNSYYRVTGTIWRSDPVYVYGLNDDVETNITAYYAVSGDDTIDVDFKVYTDIGIDSPLKDAIVRVYYPEIGSVQCITDSYGMCSINDLVIDRRYEVTATKSGYVGKTFNKILSTYEEIELNPIQTYGCEFLGGFLYINDSSGTTVNINNAGLRVYRGGDLIKDIAPGSYNYSVQVECNTAYRLAGVIDGRELVFYDAMVESSEGGSFFKNIEFRESALLDDDVGRDMEYWTKTFLKLFAPFTFVIFGLFTAIIIKELIGRLFHGSR